MNAPCHVSFPHASMKAAACSAPKARCCWNVTRILWTSLPCAFVLQIPMDCSASCKQNRATAPVCPRLPVFLFGLGVHFPGGPSSVCFRCTGEILSHLFVFIVVLTVHVSMDPTSVLLEAELVHAFHSQHHQPEGWQRGLSVWRCRICFLHARVGMERCTGRVPRELASGFVRECSPRPCARLVPLLFVSISDDAQGSSESELFPGACEVPGCFCTVARRRLLHFGAA